MKWFFTLASCLMTLAAHSSYEFERGEEIKIQEKIWRRLQDQSGSSCMLDFLSTVKVEKIKQNEIIVRYFAPLRPSAGTCENKVMLSFEPHYLDTHRDYFHGYLQRKNAVQIIKKGLSIQSMGDFNIGESYAIPDWRWAVVEEDIANFKEGDLCRIQNTSVIRIEGFYPEMELGLLKYVGSQTSVRECPENTLFFEKI